MKGACNDGKQVSVFIIAYYSRHQNKIVRLDDPFIPPYMLFHIIIPGSVGLSAFRVREGPLPVNCDDVGSIFTHFYGMLGIAIATFITIATKAVLIVIKVKKTLGLKSFWII